MTYMLVHDTTAAYSFTQLPTAAEHDSVTAGARMRMLQSSRLAHPCSVCLLARSHDNTVGDVGLA